MAEEALALKKTVDPGTSEIWTTYTILAKIAGKQQEANPARDYRRQVRQAKFAFKGTEHELQRYAKLIQAVLSAAQGNAEVRDVVAQYQEAMRQSEEKAWGKLADALDRLLAGERDEERLCESMHHNQAVIVMAILRELDRGE